jgi:hypothetical protein
MITARPLTPHRAHRQVLVVAPLHHLGDHERAEKGARAHARTCGTGERGATNERDIRESPGDIAHQPIDRVEESRGETGVVEELAHQQEHRNRHQREGRDRAEPVVDHLPDSALAAHENERAHEVGAEERDRHRQPQEHEEHR